MKNLVVQLLLLVTVLCACRDENHLYLESNPQPSLEISSDTVHEVISDPSLRTSAPRTYWITSVSPVNEGSTVTITMNTTNVSVGTVIPYTITGITADDLTSGSLTGNFTIASGGKSALSFALKADKKTEGTELLKVSAKTTSLTVQISDKSTGTGIVVPPITDVVTGVTGALFNFASLLTSQGKTYINQNNIVIENMSISGIAGNDLTLLSCTNVTIRNCYFGVSQMHGISLQTSSNITIQNCFFANNDQSIIAYKSTGVKIINNQFLNVHGSGANGVVGGNFIQFNQITGTGNEITGNIFESVDGESIGEDLISIYASSGTQASPLYIRNNTIKGGGGEGGKNISGGTIQTGDGGGAWVVVDNNKIYNPYNFGVGVSGGSNFSVTNNLVIGRSTTGNFAGVFSTNFGSGCSNINITGNKVQHTYGQGYQSGSCTNVNETSNTWSATGYSVPATVLNIAAADYTRIRKEFSIYK